jgi:hypothetical protein
VVGPAVTAGTSPRMSGGPDGAHLLATTPATGSPPKLLLRKLSRSGKPGRPVVLTMDVRGPSAGISPKGAGDTVRAVWLDRAGALRTRTTTGTRLGRPATVYKPKGLERFTAARAAVATAADGGGFLAYSRNTKDLIVSAVGSRLPSADPNAPAPAYAFADAATQRTYIAVPKPAAGTRTVEAVAGSAPIAQLLQARPLARARLGGRGRTRTLTYRVRRTGGLRTTFVETDARGRSRIIGRATKSSGRIRFGTGAGAKGVRTVTARTDRDGIPRAGTKIGTYTAPPPLRPGRPGKVRVVRRGGGLVVRFGRARRAAGYTVTARLSDGRTPFFAVGRMSRRVRIRAVPRDGGATVTVVARDRTGGPGQRRLAGHGNRTSEADHETGGSMSTRTARPAVDLAPSAPARPGLALALALLSVPGVTIAWDLSEIAGFAGTGVGIAAIVLARQARSRLAGARGTRMATVAVAVATLAVLSVAFFVIVGPPD